MPHPLYAKAGDYLVKIIPVITFIDNVSGNITWQWNKHYVIYASNAWLPREMLSHEWTIRFVTSSPHSSPMELMESFRKSLEYEKLFYII